MQSEIQHLRDALARRDTQIDQQKPATGDADATEWSTGEPTPTAAHQAPHKTQIMVLCYVTESPIRSIIGYLRGI